MSKRFKGQPPHFRDMYTQTKGDKRMQGRTHSSFGVMAAAGRGHDDLIMGRRNRNPYPPGLRRDAYNEGYYHGDPMGEHMGRNE